MRLSPAFDALEVGEVDNFAFDMTTEVGDAYVLYTNWTLALQPGAGGSDPNPQIVELSNPTSIDVRLPNNTVQTLYGAFVVARVGPCPSSAAGSIYIIGAQAALSDGRIIADNNVFECVIPGEF